MTNIFLILFSCSAGLMDTSAWGNQIMMAFGTSGSALLAARVR